MANEITDVLKEMITSGTKQDEAILKLCQAMIDRIIAIENREDSFLGAMKVQMDILKVHTDTNQKMRDVVKVIMERIEVCEDHEETLLKSVVVLKDLVDKLMDKNGGKRVH